MSIRHLLIMSDEDGNPTKWVEPAMVGDIAEIMDYYSIKRFLDAVPEDTDPSYWEQGDALLLEVRVLKVRPKEVVTTWEIERA